MVCERNTRSAWPTASASGGPRSMAPAAAASAIARAELTPTIGPSNPASRRASPKDAADQPGPDDRDRFIFRSFAPPPAR